MRCCSLCFLFTLSLSTWVSAAEPEELPKPAASSALEPTRRAVSYQRAGEYLDAAVMAWTREQNCASCHTTYAYLMARPAIGEDDAPVYQYVRRFLEHRVAHWDREDGAEGLPDGSEGVTEVVATAASLAFDDARRGDKLHPLTRKALDRMWKVQQADGGWDWNKHLLPPLEYDDYYGAVYAALGVGYAPEGYAKSDAAREGVSKLKEYLSRHRPPNLHHRAWLLWANERLDGLMSASERKETIRLLLERQRADGGWNLPSLGAWDRLDGTANDNDAPSDGYATGLTVWILRQAGTPSDDKSIARGVTWLRGNQRSSGRWFTRSLNADRDHYITNTGTAFAVMALRASE